MKVVAAFTLLCSTLKDESERTGLFLADVAVAMKAHFSKDEARSPRTTSYRPGARLRCLFTSTKCWWRTPN